jgi:hypothetical protein
LAVGKAVKPVPALAPAVFAGPEHHRSRRRVVVEAARFATNFIVLHVILTLVIGNNDFPVTGHVLSGKALKFGRGTKVRRFVVLALAGAVLGSLIPTQARSFTYGHLVGGSVRAALAYGNGSAWCLVDNGNTEFQINQSNTRGIISFAELIYFDGSTYYSLDGQSKLIFGDAASGMIHFKQLPTYPNSIQTPQFTNFTQTYNAVSDQIFITFNIVFPNCTLPIYAAYDAP